MLCLADAMRLCSMPVPRHALPTRLSASAMPLLRYARLGLSVQRLSDTVLIIATAKLVLTMPLQNYLYFASAQLIFSVPWLCLTLPTLVLAIQCPCAANPCFACTYLIGAISIPNKAIAGHR